MFPGDESVAEGEENCGTGEGWPSRPWTGYKVRKRHCAETYPRRQQRGNCPLSVEIRVIPWMVRDLRGRPDNSGIMWNIDTNGPRRIGPRRPTNAICPGRGSVDPGDYFLGRRKCGSGW